MNVYLLMEQLGVPAEGDIRKVLGFSVGDWMTVDSVMLGLVAWGFRKAETPFGQRVVAAAYKVSLFGLLFIFAIFMIQQSQALARQFMVTAPTFIWETFDDLDKFQRGFDLPMLLATAALLLTAHLMTLQFFETNSEIQRVSETHSVLIPSAQELIDFLAVRAGCCSRQEFDENFPDSAPELLELQRIGLVAQVKKRPRLTAKGREAARA
jgi:hypothetical protein